MEKFEYMYGACNRSSYRGLYPVKYVGEYESFRKAEMLCDHRTTECQSDCIIYKSAPDPFPQKEEWKLKDLDKRV